MEENEGFGQPLIPFILLIGELQMGPYMVTYWCVSECCSLIGSHRLYVYRNDMLASDSAAAAGQLTALYKFSMLQTWFFILSVFCGRQPALDKNFAKLSEKSRLPRDPAVCINSSACHGEEKDHRRLLQQ